MELSESTKAELLKMLSKTEDEKRPFSEYKEQYLKWGSVQGGRGGRPWSEIHFKHRTRYLTFWGEALSLTDLSQLENCLSRVETVLYELREKGIPQHLWKNGARPLRLDRQKPRPLSNKSLKNMVDGLCAFCDWCFRRGFIKGHPLLGLGRFNTNEKRFQRRALTSEEATRLLAVARPQHRLVYETALLSGLRRKELCCLTGNDLDAKNCQMILRPEWQKNRKETFQPISKELMQKLKTAALLKPGQPFLVIPVWRTVIRDFERAHIRIRTKEGRVDFHSLRVTYITNVVESGANIRETQTLARHSTPVLTMNVYARCRDEKLSDLAEKVASRLRSTEGSQ